MSAVFEDLFFSKLASRNCFFGGLDIELCEKTLFKMKPFVAKCHYLLKRLDFYTFHAEAQSSSLLAHEIIPR